MVLYFKIKIKLGYMNTKLLLNFGMRLNAYVPKFISKGENNYKKNNCNFEIDFILL